MDDRSDARPPQSPEIPCRSGHLVHFYEEFSELAESVSSFVEEGLRRRECVVLILSPDHRKALGRLLSDLGSQEDIHVVDARSVVDRLLVGGKPDVSRFKALTRQLLHTAAGGALRLFGEGVDVLTRSGNFEGAILLEDMWNELLSKRPFPVLCAYDINVFCRGLRGSEYRHLRSIHDGVHPKSW